MRVVLVLTLVLLSQACSPSKSRSDTQGEGPKILLVKENQKYKLRCSFYADSPSGAADENVVEYITLQDMITGRELKYAPAGADSLVLEHGYFTDVWSPNEDLLLLPRGRFDGFCIVKSSDALQSLETGKCLDYVVVELKNGTGLWHEFGKWDGSDAFTFKVGLSGEKVGFKYEISARRLKVLNRANNTFQGRNSDGKVDISDSQE
jgi:hypothetical protein